MMGGAGDNVVGKSEIKMEEDDSLRTLECLRGRLVAERVASRVATEDANQMGNKLIELEKQFRIEMKSRNRAEKRLKFLMKKLESLNITYVSDDLEQSLENSDISSVSSTTPYCTKQPEDNQPSALTTSPRNLNSGEVMKNTNFSLVSHNSGQTVSETTASSESHNSPSNEENLDSTGSAISEKSYEPESSPSNYDSKADDHSLSSLRSSIEGKATDGESDQDWDDCVDNSLALVPVDLPMTTQTIDPPIVNASVKDVLDALRHAREKLQSSIERRHLIRVG